MLQCQKQLPKYLNFPRDENFDVSIDPTKMQEFEAHLGEKIPDKVY